MTQPDFCIMVTASHASPISVFNMLVLFILIRSSTSCSRPPVFKMQPTDATEDAPSSTSEATPEVEDAVTKSTTTTYATDSRISSKPKCPPPWNLDFCFNNGTCFVTEIPHGCTKNKNCMKNCICRHKWSGIRCGERAIDSPFILPSYKEKTNKELNEEKPTTTTTTTTVRTKPSTEKTTATSDMLKERLCDNGHPECDYEDDVDKAEMEEATVIAGSVIFVLFCVASVFVAFGVARRHGIIKRLTRTTSSFEFDATIRVHRPVRPRTSTTV